jgi:hypothetical protein
VKKRFNHLVQLVQSLLLLVGLFIEVLGSAASVCVLKRFRRPIMAAMLSFVLDRYLLVASLLESELFDEKRRCKIYSFED